MAIRAPGTPRQPEPEVTPKPDFEARCAELQRRLDSAHVVAEESTAAYKAECEALRARLRSASPTEASENKDVALLDAEGHMTESDTGRSVGEVAQLAQADLHKTLESKASKLKQMEAVWREDKQKAARRLALAKQLREGVGGGASPPEPTEDDS